MNVIRCLVFPSGTARADPCLLGKDRPYCKHTLGERATSVLHPLLFGQILHQWQRILVQLVLLFARRTRLSRMLQGRTVSSSTRAVKQSLERVVLNAPLRLDAANHDLIEIPSRRSFYRKHRHITDYFIGSMPSRMLLGARIRRLSHLEHGLRVFNFH